MQDLQDLEIFEIKIFQILNRIVEKSFMTTRSK